jgi:Fungal chitosanase of glycosyl hydrolase group 75
MNRKKVENGLLWIALAVVTLIGAVLALSNPTLKNLFVGKPEAIGPLPELVTAGDADETIRQIEAKLRAEYDIRLKSDLVKEMEKARAGDEGKEEPLSTTAMLQMPRGIVSDITNLSNGIPLRTEVLYGTGETALEEIQLHDSYTATYQLKMRIPRPAINIVDIEKATPELSKILPGLTSFFPLGSVSPLYEALYRNKISDLRTNSSQLGALLSKPSAYDCNTILHLKNEKGRKIFFMQADMDAILKGSDGDRAPVMPASQVDSITYDPFSAYNWRKLGKAPNPMIAGWERRIAVGKKELAAPEITPERKQLAAERIAVMENAIEAMKKRSYLISAFDPYIVLPISVLKDVKDPFAPKIGDYAVVIHGRKIYPCIVGDAGTDAQVGEASARMAVALVPGWNSALKPVAYPGVSYLVFPGSREAETAVPDHGKWGEKCLALLQEVGGFGDAYEYHNWIAPVPAPTAGKPEIPAKEIDSALPDEPGVKPKLED